jgi:intracellular sulfur oxidation DsrE/DsrF family protein
MKQLLFVLSIVLTINAFSQTATVPVSKDSAIQNQKFFFPTSYYTDSIALIKAIPKLAEQVLAVYQAKDKRTFFRNTIPLYLLTENYKKAIDMVDSVRKIDDNNSYNIAQKSYSLAKLAEQKKAGSFDQAFKKEYSETFDQLSFRKKVRAAMVDTFQIKDDSTQFTSLREQLQKNNKDSLSLEDSRSLCEQFFHYSFDKKIIPLLSTLIGGQYRPTFPAIKSVNWAGVYPVNPIDEMPDPNMQYKLLFELSDFAFKDQDSSAKTDINVGIGSVARELNLHEANGIPRKNINAVVVIHGSALYSLLKNEKYKKKYGRDNPNIAVIKELQNYGVKMIVCGQAMTFLNLEMEDLVPGIKQALNAQTALSSYQLKNYVFFDMALRE